MIKNSTLLLVLLFHSIAEFQAQTRTWNGSVSSSWNVSANWTPSGIPASGIVNINSSTTPFPCVLDMNRTLSTLNVSNGANLDFNGFNLTVTGTSTINNCSLSNTNLTSGALAGFSNIMFNGATLLTKTVNSNNDLAGGNKFNGPLTVNNNSTSYIRFSNLVGDTINGTATFNKNGSGAIQIARNGDTFFGGDVLINSNNAGSLEFGGGTGTSTIASNHVLSTSQLSDGTVSISRLTQLGNAENGSLQPAALTLNLCAFGGDFNAQVLGSLSLNSCTFLSDNLLIGADVVLTGNNQLSTDNGVTTIIKTGGTENNWTGGNMFGTLLIENQSNANIGLASTTADTYLADVTFIASGVSAGFHIAQTGNNLFPGNIKLNSTSNSTIQFCGNNGQAIIEAGGALLTDGFTNGTLTLRNLLQEGSESNGSFNPTTFNALQNTNFGGSIDISCTGTLTLQESLFRGSNNFSGSQIILNGSNSFSTDFGITEITKTGGTNNDFQGGNIFGPVIFNNNSDGRITLANSLGDTFLSSATFNKDSTGSFQIAKNGVNTFNGNIILNNASTGELSFGIGSGQSTITGGASILTDGFTNGNLIFRGVTQNGSTPNGNFQPSNFTSSLNTTILGGISIECMDGGIITLSNSTFDGTNNFTAANINVTDECTFSSSSGTTFFTKNGSGNNDWYGSNSFGNVVFNMAGNSGRLRLAHIEPDSFSGSATFVRSGLGDLQPAFTGVNSFKGNISTLGSNQSIIFGGNSGRVLFDGQEEQTISGDASINPIFGRVDLNKPNSNLLQTVPIEITDELNLVSGLIVNNASNYLIVNQGANVFGNSSNSYVAGFVRKVGNEPFLFPIGNTSKYAPIKMSAPAEATNHFTANYIQDTPDSESLSSTALDANLEEISSCEYWKLERTSGTSAVQVSILWDEDRCAVPVSLSHLVIGSWNGNQWNNLGSAGLLGDLSSGSLTTEVEVSNFEAFVLASKANLDPQFVLLSFVALNGPNNSVLVNWSTGTEFNNEFFTVERSINGQDWETLGIQPSLGNSQQTVSYQMTDALPYFGLSYYRLKQTSIDGNGQYFFPVSVNVNTPTNNEMLIFPNPSSDFIKVYGLAEELEDLKVFNTTGQELPKRIVEEFSTINQKTLDLSTYSPGVYYIQGATLSIKFVKQ